MKSFNPIYDHLLQIPDHKLSIYLPSITLKRNSKLIYGSGHLFTDNNSLTLKIMNTVPPTKNEETTNFLMSVGSQVSIGELRSVEDYCYQMIAKDDYGNDFSCDFVEVEQDFEKTLYTCKFKSKISVFSSGGIKNKKCHASIVFKEKYSFATTKKEHDKPTLPTYLDGFPELKGIWECEIDGLSMVLHKNLRHLQLDIESTELDLDNATIKQITNTLNFVMGIEHTYYYTVYFGDENSFQIDIARNSKPSRNILFTPPYCRTGSNGDEAVENTKIFISYYNYLKTDPNSIMNKLHKRIVDSGSGYYYKHGLVISTSIESILKTFYPKESETLSQSFLEDIQQLEMNLTNLKDSVMINRFKSFIVGLSTTNNYIPGKMLAKLEKEGIIGSGSLDAWRKLRNRYAHGDDFNEELPKAVGLVLQNVTIYYELIFNLIKYDGKYTSYSIKHGNTLKNYTLV